MTMTKYLLFAWLVVISGSAFAGSALITAGGVQHDISNADKALSAVKSIGNPIVRSIDAESEVDNVIFFIHGRGEHPAKALNQIIPKLEKEYTAEVVMFHWFPSSDGPFGHPVKEARDSAASLGNVLNSYKAFLDSKDPQSDEKIKTTLLIHSMGNLVWEEYIKKHHAKGVLGGNLFDVVVMNAADVDLEGHAQWIEKIDFTKNIYITVNKKDKILSLAAKKSRKGRLGQKLKTITGKEEPLAGNATYVDFTKTRVNHRYYLVGGQNHNRFLRRFYDSVMNGESAELNSGEFGTNGFQREENGVVVFQRD